MSTVSAVY